MTRSSSHHKLRHQRFRQASQPAVTLLEIMVVIAVIALLCALLLPALAGARRQARHAACQSNLHQIGMGWHHYLSDSRGFFLKSVRGFDNYEINYGGRQGATSEFRGDKPLNPYVGAPKVVWKELRLFACPLDRAGKLIPAGPRLEFGNSYLMNPFLVGPPVLDPDPADPCSAVWGDLKGRIKRLQISQIDDPGRVLLAGDYGWYRGWFRTFESEYHMNWHGRPMHHNLLFVDGHVSLTQIRKGILIDSVYTVIPFRQAQRECASCQEEISCE